MKNLANCSLENGTQGNPEVLKLYVIVGEAKLKFSDSPNYMLKLDEIFPGLSRKVPSKFAMSTIEDGNMSYNFGDYKDVLKNRQKFLSQVGLHDDSIVLMRLRNSDLIKELSKSEFRRGITHKKAGIVADSVIVSERELYIGMTPADCIPIVIIDQKQNIFSVIHGSRFSVSYQLITKTMFKLKEKHKCRAADLILALGLAAKGRSLVYPEIKLPHESHFDNWNNYIVKTDDRHMSVDPVGYAIQQFIDSGGKQKNIIESSVDTVSDKRLFSQYRARDYKKIDNGRMLFVFGLV